MSKKVDIDLIVAFIEGSLSVEKRKFVRNLIDNDNDWFLEYMNLKEGEFEYNKYAGVKHKDDSDFSTNLLPNKNESVFASLAATTPFFNAVFIGIIAIGGASLLYFNIFKDTLDTVGVTQQSEVRSFEGQWTSISIDNNIVKIDNRFNEILNIAIVLASEYDDYADDYLNSNYFYEIVGPSESINISSYEILSYFSDEIQLIQPITIIIFGENGTVYQEETITL